MLGKIAAYIRRAQAYTKFIVAIVGGVLIIVSDEIALPDEVLKWARIGIAVLTAFSVYAFPNAPTDDGGAALEVPISDFEPKHRA